MSSKKLSISFRSWIYNTYLDNIDNKTAFIEEMFLKGVSLEVGDFEAINQKVLNLILQNRQLTEEINKKELIINSLQNKLLENKNTKKNEDEYFKEVKNKAMSIKNSGLIDNILNSKGGNNEL